MSFLQQITLPTEWRSEIEIDACGASRDLEKGMSRRTVKYGHISVVGKFDGNR